MPDGTTEIVFSRSSFSSALSLKLGGGVCHLTTGPPTYRGDTCHGSNVGTTDVSSISKVVLTYSFGASQPLHEPKGGRCHSSISARNKTQTQGLRDKLLMEVPAS